MKQLRICVLIIVLAFATACDSLLSGFRAGFAASRPFIQSLVDSGTIPQTTANLAIADVNDGINTLTEGDRCVKAITATGSAKKVAKAKCYLAAARSLRSILARHNFNQHPKLNQVFTIVEGAIAALEEYYNSVTNESSVTIQGDDPDARLERKLKDAERQLKELRNAH